MSYPYIAVWLDDQVKIDVKDIVNDKSMFYDILKHMTYYDSEVDNNNDREIFDDFYYDIMQDLDIELSRLRSYGILESDRANNGTIYVILKYLCLYHPKMFVTPIIESELDKVNCSTIINLYRCSSELITFLSQKIVGPKMFEKGI